MKAQRVYVHGLGAVSGLGNSWRDTWRQLLAGKVQLTNFSDCGFQTNLSIAVSAVPGLNRSLEVSSGIQGAAARLAKASLAECLASGVPVTNLLRVYGGTNHGETDIVLTLARTPAIEDFRSRLALWAGVVNESLPAAFATEHVDPLEFCAWCYSACASSLHALAGAQMDLQDGEGTDAVVLGVDAMSLLCVAGFVRAGAAAENGSSPFRKCRAGLLIGEGAAALSLSIRPTGRKPEVELLGLAMACDAGHPTQPDTAGIQLERALRESLQRAHLQPADVRAIICHGTGTVANDLVEAAVCRRIWPKANVPVTSLKGSIGHCMGASGLFNCLAAVEVCRTGWVPPTVGTGSEALPGIDLVTEARRVLPGGPVITVASGFGGNHVAIVLGSR